MAIQAQPERARKGVGRPANKKTEGGLSQHQVSVRREAAHIRSPGFELVQMTQTFLRTEREGSLMKKRLMISAFAAVALLGATTAAVLRAPSTELSAGTAAMPSLQELHTAAGVNKLPNQEIDDH